MSRSETVTDRLVQQELSILNGKLEKEYAILFPTNAAPPEFWVKFLEVDIELGKRLSVRPLARIEISNQGVRAFKSIAATMRRLAPTVKQPKQETLLHIDLGTGDMKVKRDVELS